MSIDNQLLAFNTISIQNLGGKNFLVYFMVIEDPLDFNMLLRCDYVYSMKFVVSTLFRVMYFLLKYFNFGRYSRCIVRIPLSGDEFGLVSVIQRINVNL